MPFLSDSQVERLQNMVQGVQRGKERALAAARERKEELIQIGETVGAAAAMGYVRGKYEKDGSKFVIPGTSIDIQAIAGLAALGAGLARVAGKFDDDLVNVGSGLLAGYAQDVFRAYGKTDSISMVAGRPMVGAGSHLGHQFGQPGVGSMNDHLRSALSAV